MDRPPPLNLIRLGNEWLVTNGQIGDDASIRFPEDDPAEETFDPNGSLPSERPPDKPPTPAPEA